MCVCVPIPASPILRLCRFSSPVPGIIFPGLLCLFSSQLNRRRLQAVEGRCRPLQEREKLGSFHRNWWGGWENVNGYWQCMPSGPMTSKF